jgi:hypothetical protein
MTLWNHISTNYNITTASAAAKLLPSSLRSNLVFHQYYMFYILMLAFPCRFANLPKHTPSSKNAAPRQVWHLWSSSSGSEHAGHHFSRCWSGCFDCARYFHSSYRKCMCLDQNTIRALTGSSSWQTKATRCQILKANLTSLSSFFHRNGPWWN